MPSDAPEESWARRRLDVGPKAGPREIRRAFRRLSKIHHPDRGGSPDEFEEIRLAHELLRHADHGGTVWLTDEVDDPESPWFAYDSPPPPRRTTFRQALRDALDRTD